MIVLDVPSGDRQGRLFVLGSDLPDPSTLANLAGNYMDEEDAARELLLRGVLAAPVVEATIHPGVDPEDISQVYLASPGGPLFACTLISTSRLLETLAESTSVFEDFCLQVVAPGGSIAAALEVWARRNFPGLVAPMFSLEPWNDDASLDLAFEPLELGAIELPAGELPTSIAPDPAQLGLTDEAA